MWKKEPYRRVVRFKTTPEDKEKRKQCVKAYKRLEEKPSLPGAELLLSFHSVAAAATCYMMKEKKREYANRHYEIDSVMDDATGEELMSLSFKSKEEADAFFNDEEVKKLNLLTSGSADTGAVNTGDLGPNKTVDYSVQDSIKNNARFSGQQKKAYSQFVQSYDKIAKKNQASSSYSEGYDEPQATDKGVFFSFPNEEERATFLTQLAKDGTAFTAYDNSGKQIAHSNGDGKVYFSSESTKRDLTDSLQSEYKQQQEKASEAGKDGPSSSSSFSPD